MPIDIGLALLLVSLTAGFYFLTYAIRYYIAIIIAIITALKGNDEKRPQLDGNPEEEYQLRFPQNANNNLELFRSIKLKRIILEKSERIPFISIHVPIYNEKNVINRLLKALTNLNYPRYEIILVDDSTDETTTILKEKWESHPRVKIIYRKGRKGFKGGALREALRYMNPEAEYVVVFDADFIPPSNILWILLSELRNPNNTHPLKKIKHDVIRQRNIVAVQGYQRHILNAGENWITLAVRSAYAGNYLIDHLFAERVGGLKMITGSVFMIRADILKRYGWRDSLTEDWDLTIRLYRDGYRVKYSLIAAAPAECPSTFLRMIKQHMRWAEGHTHAVKRYLHQILTSKMLTIKEKLEFLYLAPFYLNSMFYLIGTLTWFFREFMGFSAYFWTSALGWSLILTNTLSIPLLSLTGLFMEYSARRHWRGAVALLILLHLSLPFIALAALKGLLKSREGMWFRTPKTGKITEQPFFRLRGLRGMLSRELFA